MSILMKPKGHLIWLTVVVLLAVMAGPALALWPDDGWDRPAKPVMDYVPQNYGIYDTYRDFYAESDCRICHGGSMATRHHTTYWATTAQCLNCHCEWPDVVPPERDCVICHKDDADFCQDGGAPDGDFGSPHHRTQLSGSEQCTGCHSNRLLSETNTVPDKLDPPDPLTTPSPFACENCHWPTNCEEVPPFRSAPSPWERKVGRMVTASGPCTDDATEFANDWADWPYQRWLADGPALKNDGWPKPSTPDGYGSEVPAPIMANGKMERGDLNTGDYTHPLFGTTTIGKAFQPLTGLHHEIGGWEKGNVYPKCRLCHSTDPDTVEDYTPFLGTEEDPLPNPFLIRSCQNCHDRYTLHDIKEHVMTNDLYTVGGVEDPETTIDDNWKCYACHGDYMIDPPPISALPTPVLTHLEPDVGSPGIVIDIWGTNQQFGEQYTSPNNGNDHIQVKTQGSPAVWTAVEAYDWTDNLVRVKLPGAIYFDLLPFSSKIRVAKRNLAVPLGAVGEYVKSNAVSFVVRKHPVIDTVTPGQGGFGTTVVLDGNGYAHVGLPYQEDIDGATGYGYSTYVLVGLDNDVYRARKYPSAWSQTQIDFLLGGDHDKKQLMDLKSGSLVVPPQVYEGTWDVYVVTDYFKDDGDGVYNYGQPSYVGTLPLWAPRGLDLSYESLIGLGEWDDSDTPENEITNFENFLDGPRDANGDETAGLLGNEDAGPGTGDFLYHREVSTAAAFTVVDAPVITWVTKKIHALDKAKVVGFGFGTAQGNAEIQLHKKKDGSGTYKVVPPGKSKVWTPTLIKFKMITFGTYPQKRWIRIVRPGSPNIESNLMKIKKIWAPNP